MWGSILLWNVPPSEIFRTLHHRHAVNSNTPDPKLGARDAATYPIHRINSDSKQKTSFGCGAVDVPGNIKIAGS